MVRVDPQDIAESISMQAFRDTARSLVVLNLFSSRRFNEKIDRPFLKQDQLAKLKHDTAAILLNLQSEGSRFGLLRVYSKAPATSQLVS